MRIGVLIHARSSHWSGLDCRCVPLGPRSVAGHVLERVGRLRDCDDPIVIASTDVSDDAIADLCRTMRIRCVRSPLDRPAQAMATSLAQTGWDAFVWLRMDAPLIDPELIADAVESFRSGDWDLVTNRRPMSFPVGQEVEVLRSRLLLQRAPFLRPADVLTSVTQWFQRVLPPQRIQRLKADGLWSDVSMSVESMDDLERLRWLVDALGPALFRLPWRVVATEMRRLGCASRELSDEAAA